MKILLQCLSKNQECLSQSDLTCEDVQARSNQDMREIKLCLQQVLHLVDVILSFQLPALTINAKAPDLIAETHCSPIPISGSTSRTHEF